jgi:tyrosinase
MKSVNFFRVMLLAALAIYLGVFQSTVRHRASLVNAQSVRVRRAWRSYSDPEKDLFLQAVKRAMESGMHYRFTEIHSSRPSYDHAHNNCGFLLWHRKFILAYENMLRAQDPIFKDVTLPYWNYFQDHDMHLASGDACDSWLTCSKFLADLGGSDPTYPEQTVQIAYAAPVTGFCVANGVTEAACALPSGFRDSSGTCDQCIVRGDWSSEANFFPLSRADIIGTIREIDDVETTTSNAHDVLRYHLEMGFHADVHNALSGVMETTASPFDPVFYGHHGTVDMLHFVHNRCHYGEKDSKRFDVFSRCTVTEETTSGPFEVSIRATTDIVMNYGSEPAEDDPVVGPFFQGIGSTYRDFANAEKLHDASNNYRYEVDSYFETLFKSEGIECPSYVYASSTPLRKKHRHLRGKHHYHDKDKSSEANDHEANEQQEEPNPVYEMIETLAACGNELRERMPNISRVDVAVQESILECEATRQRSGQELQDYTPEFRQMFRIPNESLPHCFGLLQEVKKGAITLQLSDHCRQEYGRLTATNLTDGDFGKPFPSENNGGSSDSTATDEQTEHDSADDSSDSGDEDTTRAQKNRRWRVSIKVHSE